MPNPTFAASHFPFPSAHQDWSNTQVAALSTVVSAILVLLYYFHGWIRPSRLVDKSGCPIPPGPAGLPIVGSFPFLARYPEVTLDYWAKKFGPLYSFWLGTQLCVVISDPQIVKDLLVTNGAIFSSRKRMFIKSRIFDGRGITDTPYGSTWRKYRRLVSAFLGARAVDGYNDTFDLETAELLKALYRCGQAGAAPVNPRPHAGRFSLNVMLSIVYSDRTDSINHPLVAHALKLAREFMNCAGPVSNLVDFIPLLQRLPNGMTSRGEKLHRDLVKTYGGMALELEERMKRGEIFPKCFAKAILEAKEKEKLDHLDISILCSALMIGGIDTTTSVILWFSGLIPAYPEIQAKAQAELDRVVGRDRLPTPEDESDLPFVHALIKEIERVHNPLWLGTPHFSLQDFTYRDQFIPKETVIIINSYTMHHDPNRHPDHDNFNVSSSAARGHLRQRVERVARSQPERYINDSTLSSESTKLANPYKRDHWMFGAGRRVCPGMLVAEREIFLCISRMLWAFRIEEIPGEPIDLKSYAGLSGRSPVPFKVRMIPRDERVTEVLGI